MPDTRYADSGGCAIAYQVVGDGPVDLLFVPGLISHLDLQWCDPVFSDALRRLASFSRLIIVDQRGVGLSDPCPTVPTVDERVADLVAVVDAAGARDVYVLGQCAGGPAAIVYAATHPERVAGLILMSTFAKGAADDANPAAIPPDAFAVAMDAIDHWGEGRTLALWNPSRAEGRVYRRLYATFERAALTKGMARAAIASTLQVDVTAALDSVTAPALVLHCTDDFMTVEAGKYLAAALPDSRFIELIGADHAPFSGAGASEVIDHVHAFVSERAPVTPAPLERFGAVLMTDIVASMEVAAELGDQRWAELLMRHDVAAREEIDRHGGECIKFTGDGYLATFTSCESALWCATALDRVATGFGLQIRCGVHAGGYEPSGQDVIGMTVNITARLMDAAGASDILVSEAVCASVAGAGFHLSSLEPFELKGLASPLFAARLVAAPDPERPSTRWRPDPAEDRDLETPVDRVLVAIARRRPELARAVARARRPRAQGARTDAPANWPSTI
jgi:pimeloyl-ACP methyl ester carboxylesterase/class 3 adenylate cyclase